MQVYVVCDCTDDVGPVGVARTKEQAIDIAKEYLRNALGKKVSIHVEHEKKESGKQYIFVYARYLGEVTVVMIEGFELPSETA